MGETVEQGRGHLGIAEDGCPFAEAEVGGDDDAGALIELAQQVEEQRSAFFWRLPMFWKPLMSP